ncbi:hypothetical protein [Rhizobium anhuiense]|nr:hypothetical protein [Rhizobium anhuiense]
MYRFDLVDNDTASLYPGHIIVKDDNELWPERLSQLVHWNP